MKWLILQKNNQTLRQKLLTILLTLSFFSGFAAPTGPNNKYFLLHNFKGDWLEYDADKKQFVPQIEENNPQSKIHTLTINLNDYPHANILMLIKSKNNYLFLDRTLLTKIPENKWLIYSAEKLRSIAKKDLVVLSIYGDVKLDNITVTAGYFRNETVVNDVTAKTNFLINFLPRNFSPYQSGMALIFIICMLIISFLANNYVKTFRKFYDFRDLISVAKREKSFIIAKPLDRPNLIFVILVSVISAFIIINLQSHQLDFISKNWLFTAGNTFGVLISNFFKLSVFIFLLFVLKFFFITAAASLFGIEKTVDLHYFKIIQSSLIFFSLFLIILLISQNIYLNINQNLREISLAILIIFYGFRTLIVYLTLNQSGNVKTLYLISYLCIVEILPILIGFSLVD